MTKLTKEESNYGRGMINSHCGKVFSNDTGYCQHFRDDNGIHVYGTCTEVEGQINRTYWCKEFLKVKK